MKNYKMCPNPISGYVKEAISIAHISRLTGLSRSVVERRVKANAFKPALYPWLVFCDFASAEFGSDLYSDGLINQGWLS